MGSSFGIEHGDLFWVFLGWAVLVVVGVSLEVVSDMM